MPSKCVPYWVLVLKVFKKYLYDQNICFSAKYNEGIKKLRKLRWFQNRELGFKISSENFLSFSLFRLFLTAFVFNFLEGFIVYSSKHFWNQLKGTVSWVRRGLCYVLMDRPLKVILPRRTLDFFRVSIFYSHICFPSVIAKDWWLGSVLAASACKFCRQLAATHAIY